ncbi:MAG TPA: oligosaccharide flippase family protein [bacterium]|nr:oligosaccharide flippase family protein [bacterium]
MNRTRRIAANLSYLFIGEGISVVLAFMTTIWLARRLTDEGFGRLAYVQSIIMYFAILIDLGLAVFGTREIARQPAEARRIGVNIFAIRMSIAATIVLLFFLLVFFLPLNLEMKLLLAFGSLALLTQALNPEFLFQGLERMGGIALWRILIHGLYLLPVLLFVHSRQQLVLTPVFRFAAEGLSVVVVFSLIRRQLPGSWRAGLDLSLWPRYVKESVVIAMAVLVMRLYYSFDTLMLGALDQPEVVGWYSAALKIAQLLLVAGSLIQASFAPFLVKESASPERMDAVVLRFGVLLTIIGGLASGVILLSNKFIVTTLYGTGYHRAEAPLMILCLATLVNYMATTFSGALIFGGRQKAFLTIVIAATVMNVALNVALIPRFSYMGAAWANLGFNIAFLGLGIKAYSQIGRSLRVLRHLAFICLAYGVLAFAVFQWPVHPLWRASAFALGFSALMGLVYRAHLTAFVANVRRRSG